MYFIYKIVHFIDYFFGELKKTIYFRFIKKENLTLNPPILCQNLSEKRRRKPHFY